MGKIATSPITLLERRFPESIGNALGKYIDRSEPKSATFACAHICVEVDVKKGHPEAIKISLDH